jgi:hypothetical protein
VTFPVDHGDEFPGVGEFRGEGRIGKRRAGRVDRRRWLDEEIRLVGTIVVHLLKRRRVVPADAKECGGLTGCEQRRLAVPVAERVLVAFGDEPVPVDFARSDSCRRPRARESHAVRSSIGTHTVVDRIARASSQ